MLNPRALLSASLLIGLVWACDSASAPPSVEEGPCGVGALEVAYGVGEPLVPLEDEPLSIEYGLQGGFHVDVSLRFTGELNPDLVDVSLRLAITRGDNPGGVYGEHNTFEWYLLFPDEGEAPGCYFYRARVFLFDEAGEVPTHSHLEALTGAEATLSLSLTHLGGRYQDQARFELRFIPPPE